MLDIDMLHGPCLLGHHLLELLAVLGVAHHPLERLLVAHVLRQVLVHRLLHFGVSQQALHHVQAEPCPRLACLGACTPFQLIKACSQGAEFGIGPSGESEAMVDR